ncbi:hypothetical protein K435DRAFT_781664 [Dendrothele bispora CBS 962.96]|uniref:Ubiquitin-like domain-containing protein n=1 Tax=Dendrothele bispora (strain CBS 962.96) TaxID=1314807 RepID=A0A4S8LJM3_DENBC|nr:hypothetical protein K435DRAFT_781664 [Dendrothele bispora CBS 962.96]
MLSEKAKGKQRAIEPLLDESSSSASGSSTTPVSRNLTIRFTEDLPDLDVLVRESDTVRDVKKAIRHERPELKDRRLRLIHSGRLLTDGTMVFPWLKSLDERQKRAVADSNIGDMSIPSVAAWLHCSVGGKLEDNEEESEETQTAQIRPPRGFDRFVSLGFTEEEIANLRRHFHRQAPNSFLDNENFDRDEDYDEHFRALEEQWIDSMDSSENIYLSQSSSSNSTAIQGILIGFFFPFLPFFIQGSKPPPPVFWENGREQPAVESVVFSRTMQFGLAAGFLTNILLGLWRFLLDSS